jgi:hypothetical protein
MTFVILLQDIGHLQPISGINGYAFEFNIQTPYLSVCNQTVTELHR